MSPSIQSPNRSSSYHNIYGVESTIAEDQDSSHSYRAPHRDYTSRTLPRVSKHKLQNDRRSVSPDLEKRSKIGECRVPPVRGVGGDSYIYTPPPGLLQRAPSQVTMHYTTVPQSLVTRQLGSRHHPTRSSLRRSRLLVLVRNGTVPRKYLPGVVEQEKLGIFLNLAQLILGILATALAIWRVISSNNISRAEDWPYYSGLMVMCSGWFGLILLVNCRYLYPGVSHHPCIFPIRTYHIVGCVILSTAGGVSALVSAVCYTLHLITYSYSNCQDAKTPPDWPVEACVCLSSTLIWSNGELVYPATSCTQVEEVVPPFLLSLLLMNLASFAAILGFLALLTSANHVRTFKEWRRRNNNNNNVNNNKQSVNQLDQSIVPML